MTDDAFAMAHEHLAAAIARMALSEPYVANGEIDVVDYNSDCASELMRTELGLLFSDPVSTALRTFVSTVATMNVTFKGRGERIALVADGSLGRALAEAKTAAALAPEYATMMIVDAAEPFADLASRHRFW